MAPTMAAIGAVRPVVACVVVRNQRVERRDYDMKRDQAKDTPKVRPCWSRWLSAIWRPL